MSSLSTKRTPLGALRVSGIPGMAGFDCGFCGYRVRKRTSPNALAQWAKARGAIGAHIREKHAAAVETFKATGRWPEGT